MRYATKVRIMFVILTTNLNFMRPNKGAAIDILVTSLSGAADGTCASCRFLL